MCKYREHIASLTIILGLMFLFPNPSMAVSIILAPNDLTNGMWESTQDISLGDDLSVKYHQFLTVSYYSATQIGLDDGESDENEITADIFTDDNTPIPEPGTLILLGLGLVSLAGFGRMRHQE